ncbi:MAG: glycosyltransferase, partial [Flavobacteriales bacterium]|nr:glycosyltransferase [Flavobacteriales bacterium]
NVLYLSYDGLTDTLGRSQVLPYILGLCQKGHTYTIVSFEKEARFKSEEKAIRELILPHKIDWIPLKYTSSPPVFSTVYDVLKLKRTVKKLHKKKNFDIVHCRSYITSLAGISLKQKFGVKFIFDMRAFYADERVDGGLWNLKNPVYRRVFNYFKNKEKQFLQTADHTISLTEKGRNIIHGWKEVKNQPVSIEVIPCCADLAHFHPSQVNLSLQTELKQQFGLRENDLVLTYLGSIGTWYLLDEMLDFFKVYRSQNLT